MKINLKIEVHEKVPDGFKPSIEVAAIYIEVDGKLLLLKQGVGKPETGAWGVPAGKIEQLEDPKDAARRELFEETGVRIDSGSQLRSIGSLYIRKPELDYVFHLFQVKLATTPSISISPEHQSFQWLAIQNLNGLNLMSGAKEALNYYQRKTESSGKMLK